MLIYLDNCCLQRPFDDRSQQRIRVEAEAVLAVIEMVERGDARILSSDALRFETERTPDRVRREFATAVLGKAERSVEATEEVLTRAAVLVRSGARPLDALHLASAEAGGARYFCTTDDRLLKVAKRVGLERTEAVSLLRLIEEVGHGGTG